MSYWRCDTSRLKAAPTLWQLPVGAAFSRDEEITLSVPISIPLHHTSSMDIRSFKKDSQQLKWQHPKTKSNP